MEDDTLVKIEAELYKMFPGELNHRKISSGDKIKELGLNSVTFIKLAVALEAVFGIKFADEDLSISRYETVGDLALYVENKIQSRGDA